MGDRGNIIIKEEDGNKIYFYTHWRGSDIKQILADALEKGRSCWDDEPYLARIIFSELTKGNEGLTGFGISTYITDGEDKIIEVDMANKKVGNLSFEEFIQENKK